MHVFDLRVTTTDWHDSKPYPKLDLITFPPSCLAGRGTCTVMFKDTSNQWCSLTLERTPGLRKQFKTYLNYGKYTSTMIRVADTRLQVSQALNLLLSHFFYHT